MAGEGPTDDINGSFDVTEQMFSITLCKAKSKFCLSLHYNADEKFDYVESEEVSFKGNIYNFQAITMLLMNFTKFGLIKQVFFVLLNFSTSLAAECISLNNKPCVTRPALFLTAIWLPHDQLFTEGTVPITAPNVNHCVVMILT